MGGKTLPKKYADSKSEQNKITAPPPEIMVLANTVVPGGVLMKQSIITELKKRRDF